MTESIQEPIPKKGRPRHEEVSEVGGIRKRAFGLVLLNRSDFGVTVRFLAGVIG